MRLLFDLSATQAVSGRQYHGAAEYAKSVLKQLVADSANDSLVGVYRSGVELAPDVLAIFEDHPVDLVPFASDRDLQEIMSNYPAGRFFSALPYRYHRMDFDHQEVVFAIHGLRPVEMPTDRYEVRYRTSISEKLKAVAKLALRKRYVETRKEQIAKLLRVPCRRLTLIAVSYHTKNALCTHFPELNSEQIEVLYSPETALSNRDDVADYNLGEIGVSNRKYFLLVGGDRWIKNSYRAVRALDDMFSTYDLEFKTVVIGVGNPRMYSVTNSSNFRFLPYVSVRQLITLYRNAFCLLFPTLNEGFGYPPLESMSYGTPVLCSPTTSLPEICGDAALYFDPYSKDELQNRLLYLIHEQGFWQELSSRSTRRYRFVAQKQADALQNLCTLLLAEI